MMQLSAGVDYEVRITNVCCLSEWVEVRRTRNIGFEGMLTSEPGVSLHSVRLGATMETKVRTGLEWMKPGKYSGRSILNLWITCVDAV